MNRKGNHIIIRNVGCLHHLFLHHAYIRMGNNTEVQSQPERQGHKFDDRNGTTRAISFEGHS